tara:strand:- start:1799 stop:2566 length:768 start_codon:yes stop_codon:yes gene_type:complete
MLRKTALCSLIFAAFHSYAEPVIYTGDHQKNELFSASLQVDESMPHGNKRGSDMFLQEGSDGRVVSKNVEFDNVKYKKHYDYNFDDVFSWSLTRNGNETEFRIGKYKLKNTSLEGEWNALSFSLINSFYLFDDALITLSIDTWNDSLLSTPLSYSLGLGYAGDFILADDNKDAITNVEGTIAFDADLSWWSKFFNDSPGESLSSTWTAYNLYGFDDVDEVDVPDTGDDIKEVNSPLAFIATCGLALMLVGRIKRS